MFDGNQPLKQAAMEHTNRNRSKAFVNEARDAAIRAARAEYYAAIGTPGEQAASAKVDALLNGAS